MTNFNRAEKYPNAIEGMLAGQGLGGSSDVWRTHAPAYPYSEDEENAIVFETMVDVLDPWLNWKNLRRHASISNNMVVWNDYIAAQEASLLVVSNDNDDVTSWPASSRGKGPGHIGQQIARELSRLATGWAGEGSAAPSNQVIRDLLTVSSLFPVGTVEPDTEVDPEDGSVVLRWLDDESQESFTLTFLGKGDVGGCYSSTEGSPAWKLRVSDTSHITSKLMNEGIITLITA